MQWRTEIYNNVLIHWSTHYLFTYSHQTFSAILREYTYYVRCQLNINIFVPLFLFESERRSFVCCGLLRSLSWLAAAIALAVCFAACFGRLRRLLFQKFRAFICTVSTYTHPLTERMYFRSRIQICRLRAVSSASHKSNSSFFSFSAFWPHQPRILPPEPHARYMCCVTASCSLATTSESSVPRC